MKVSNNRDMGIGIFFAVTVIASAVFFSSCNEGGEIFRETHGRHPATAGSLRYSDKVLEYTPAPGMFINNPGQFSGFTGNETTPRAAAEYARKRLEKGYEVSLGGYGGFIVVGFDHSVQAWGAAFGEYDFSITGNQFSGSSEPGIVWVAQDVNGNGLHDPDEPWYEIKGSEYGKPETRSNYSVTYFRPSGAGQDIVWRDSEGLEGTLKYTRSEHSPQDSYYPLWMESEESYTGTCLESRLTVLPNGNESAGDFGWGYADNMGSDMIRGQGNKNFFKISNAVDAQGNPAELKYIDFVKIQTGVNAQGNVIWDISTEVSRITDENLGR